MTSVLLMLAACEINRVEPLREELSATQMDKLEHPPRVTRCE